MLVLAREAACINDPLLALTPDGEGEVTRIAAALATLPQNESDLLDPLSLAGLLYASRESNRDLPSLLHSYFGRKTAKMENHSLPSAPPHACLREDVSLLLRLSGKVLSEISEMLSQPAQRLGVA